jgi:hypothetical protein
MGKFKVLKYITLNSLIKYKVYSYWWDYSEYWDLFLSIGLSKIKSILIDEIIQSTKVYFNNVVYSSIKVYYY